MKKQVTKLQWLLLLVIVVMLGVVAYTALQPDERQSSREKTQAQTIFHEQYGFRFSLEQDWHVYMRSASYAPTYALARDETLTAVPQLHDFGAYTYVSVLPEGLATEFPSGDYSTVPSEITNTVSFAIDTERSRMYQLADGTPFGYVLFPEVAPDNWDANGFIVAYAAIDNFSAECRSGETNDVIPLDACDPLTGDAISYHGEVSSSEWEAVENILGSVSLIN